MPKISEYYEVGNREDMTLEEILRVMEAMYRDLARAINQKPDVYERTTDGQVSDVFLSNGDININSTTNKVEMLTQHLTTTTVQWTQIS